VEIYQGISRKNMSLFRGKIVEISMEKPKENCPQCGKKVKFLKKHIKRAHPSGENPGKIPGNFQEISRENPREKPKNSFLKEIDLQEEYRNMAEKVDLKKPPETEPKYECPACGEKFNEKKRFCPGCGVEFA
jgi:rRNA maturation endonuclease Nob1